jgi:hypothetical protein
MKRLRRLALAALLGLSACGLTGQKPSEVMKEFEALCVHNTQGKEVCVTDTPGGKDALAEKMGLEWKAFDGNFQADHRGVRLTYVPGWPRTAHCRRERSTPSTAPSPRVFCRAGIPRRSSMRRTDAAQHHGAPRPLSSGHA